MSTLPVDGQLDWGDPLNAGILSVETAANQAQTNIDNHSANQPADPHGDRSYAQSLVNPITTGTNQPNGYVKLNSSGGIPIGLLSASGGMFNAIFDAVATYGAVPGGSDSSTAIQNALNAAATAGGGLVWIGPGNFSLAKYLVIGSNTWLLLSEGTTLTRIAGSPNAPYIISNVQFGTNNSPATNVKISGGKLDAVGASLSTACTPIFIIQSSKTVIEDMLINCVFNNPAIEVNGCAHVDIRGCRFSGTNKSSGPAATAPAIRVNQSSTTTTPTGLANTYYNNTYCSFINVSDCSVDDKTNTFSPYNGFIGSDLFQAGSQHRNITVTGNSIGYNDSGNSSVYVPSANWSPYSLSGNNFIEYTPSFNGWNSINLIHGWSNSGIGSNFQYRFLFMGGSSNAVNTPYPTIDSIEIIGDLLTGTTADGTVIGAITAINIGSLLLPNTAQILGVTFPGTSFAQNARLFFPAGSSNIECEGMGSLGSNVRVSVHGIISLSA